MKAPTRISKTRMAVLVTKMILLFIRGFLHVRGLRFKYKNPRFKRSEDAVKARKVVDKYRHQIRDSSAARHQACILERRLFDITWGPVRKRTIEHSKTARTVN